MGAPLQGDNNAEKTEGAGGTIDRQRRIIALRRKNSSDLVGLDGGSFGFGAMRPSEFVDLAELGSGFGGVVYRSVHLPTGRLMARKLISSRISSAKIRKSLAAELATLRRCHHANILHCYGAFLTGLQVSIALEYMDCGAFDSVLKRCGPLPEPVLAEVARSVLRGLEYLHRELNIMHRDLKPSNVLLNSRGQIKLGDFGESIELVNSLATSLVGTTGYMAPERVQGETYSIKSDIWSLGITLVELATGCFPYALPLERRQEMGKIEEEGDMDGDGVRDAMGRQTLSVVELWESICSDPPPSLSAEHFSPALRDFVAACLRKEHGTRPDLGTLLRHAFVRPAQGGGEDGEFKEWLRTHLEQLCISRPSPALARPPP